MVFLGRLFEARARFEESVAIYRDLGFGGSASSLSLAVLGWVDMLLGRYDQAGISAQAALAMAQERGYRFGMGCSLFVCGGLAIVEGSYTHAHQTLEQNRSMIEQKIDFLGVIAFLGYLRSEL